MLISKYGAMAGCKMVRALHIAGGSYNSSGNWLIYNVKFSGKFLVNPPSDFYYSRYTGTQPPNNTPSGITHGQTFCRFWDYGINSNASPAAYQFDQDWHNYEFTASVWSGGCKIWIDGVSKRQINIANGMYQTTTVNYNQRMFTNCHMYIKNMQVYCMDGKLKHDWDFENGDDIPVGWSNATIENVKL